MCMVCSRPPHLDGLEKVGGGGQLRVLAKDGTPMYSAGQHGALWELGNDCIDHVEGALKRAMVFVQFHHFHQQFGLVVAACGRGCGCG